MRNKSFLLSSLFFVLNLQIYAQGYGTAIGARLNDGIGLTVQQQVALTTTAEGIIQSGLTTKDVTASLLLEQHTNILTRALNFYSGLGIYHTWLEPNDNLKVAPKNPSGLTGVVGMEFKLFKLVVAIDAKPSLRLMGDGNSFEWHTGLSLRYIIAPRIFRKKWWNFLNPMSH